MCGFPFCPPSSLLRVGMHTWQRNSGQIHVDTGSLGAALVGRDLLLQASWAKAELLAAPGWSEALPTPGLLVLQPQS